jgi:hypothetical protein
LTTGNAKLAGGAKITASQSFFERKKMESQLGKDDKSDSRCHSYYSTPRVAPVSSDHVMYTW